MKQDSWPYSTSALVKYTVFLGFMLGVAICGVFFLFATDGLEFNTWQTQALLWGVLLNQNIRILLRRVNTKEPTP